MISPGNRLVRSRKKGSLLPEGAVYVGRPTMWGNPFQDRAGGHARSVIVHAKWLEGRVGEPATPFNAARWQAEMDSEGLTARIRALRTAARAQGEPGLLAGVSLLLATMALLPFFAAVMG